jgi:hypothetical protein
MNVLLAHLAEQPIVFVRQECIIELDQESGVDNRAVFVLERVSEGSR